MLQVTNATPAEMDAIKAACTAKVTAFQRRGYNNWDGSISMCWYIDGYYYVPAGCWQRLVALRQPDIHAYRPAYDVQFVDSEKFFNAELTYDDVKSFVDTLNPAFDDIDDQVKVLWTILTYRLSSHNIATGFGKTYLSYLLAQYTAKVFNGKTLMIVPRVQLVVQGIDDIADYQKTIDVDDRINCYGICGGFRNVHRFEDADIYIGTYQSIADMPDDMFTDITTVICDEGHTAKAMSVKASVSKCQNAQIVTAISGTMKYCAPADLLTIEQYCGPMISDYPAISQIEKGRLPRIGIQRIILHHNDGEELYKTMLMQERLPSPKLGYPPELAATYRRLEFNYLGSNLHMMNYLLQLCSSITSCGKNVLVIFANRQPAINVFEYANSQGHKAHLILGGTPADVRSDIKHQLENEGGWILSATTGVMSMGVSIKNLHAVIMCMIGHSPHVVLQSIGRMLRKHPDKFAVTMCYDIVNDFSAIGSNFDLSNANVRLDYYKKEGHPIYEDAHRAAENY